VDELDEIDIEDGVVRRLTYVCWNLAGEQKEKVCELLSGPFLGVGVSFRQLSLKIFATMLQLIVLRSKFFVARQQQIIVLDTMIYNELQRVLILFKVCNTTTERCSIVLTKDS
jgi:hypothetical protein